MLLFFIAMLPCFIVKIPFCNASNYITFTALATKFLRWFTLLTESANFLNHCWTPIRNMRL